MAEFAEVIRKRNKMCNALFDADLCGRCKLERTNNGKDIYCGMMIEKYPEEAERIIIEWNDEYDQQKGENNG